MKLFNNLFKSSPEDFDSDNKRLLDLIAIYWKDHANMKKYEDVLSELKSPRPVLFFMVEKYLHKHPDSWTNEEIKDLTMNVVEMDGLLALGAFTNKNWLVEWTKKPDNYTAMRSRDLLKIALTTTIDRIVINNKKENWFFLNREYDNSKDLKPKSGTPIIEGTPTKSLDVDIINKLTGYFDELGTVLEAFQYLHSIEGEGFSYVLAVKLKVNSDNAKKAVQNSLHRAISNIKLPIPIDLFFIEKEDSYIRIKQIENSLFYKLPIESK